MLDDLRDHSSPAGEWREARTVLGVERSATGRRWILRSGDAATAIGISSQLASPEIIGRLLASRGLDEITAPAFLSPTLRALLPEPNTLLDMEAAAGRLAQAARSGEKVAVFGDFDVDGACSGAIMGRYLRALGCTTIHYVPHRLTEGYGPNPSAMLSLCEQGATLIVTVDCGIAAVEAIAAVEGRADVIILDHHPADNLLPKCLAAVNPNRLDCRSGLHKICATAVAFLAAVATNRLLRSEGFFVGGRKEPDLKMFLDMVALATVCDVMPLSGVNRAFVSQGLKVLADSCNPGLRALLEVCDQKGAPDTMALGHKLGPRINAGGRISDEPLLGTRLLMTDDPDEAMMIAENLNRINQDRRGVEQRIREAASVAAEKQLADGHAVILVCDDDWHPGVVGIVAGRLKEKYNRPALVGGLDSNGLIKGSGRSLPGLDLGQAIIAARNAGLLTSGGGHAMAAGFGCAKKDIDRFHEFLDQRLAEAQKLPAAPDLEVEETTRVAAATLDLIRQVNRLAPFGNGNSEPLFAVANARIAKAERFGKEGATIRAYLEGQGGGHSLKAIMFNAKEGPLSDLLLNRANGKAVHICGRLQIDAWGDREPVPVLKIEDIALVEAE